MSIATIAESVTSSELSDRWLDDAILFGALSAAGLLTQHVVLWEEPQRLTRPAAFVLGTATWYGAGALGWALRHRQVDALTAWLAGGIIATMSGGAVIGAYWLRSVLAQLHAGAVAGGQLNGRVVEILRRERADGHTRDDPPGGRGGAARRHF